MSLSAAVSDRIAEIKLAFSKELRAAVYDDLPNEQLRRDADMLVFQRDVPVETLDHYFRTLRQGSVFVAAAMYDAAYKYVDLIAREYTRRTPSARVDVRSKLLREEAAGDDADLANKYDVMDVAHDVIVGSKPDGEYCDFRLYDSVAAYAETNAAFQRKYKPLLKADTVPPLEKLDLSVRGGGGGDPHSSGSGSDDDCGDDTKRRYERAIATLEEECKELKSRREELVGRVSELAAQNEAAQQEVNELRRRTTNVADVRALKAEVKAAEKELKEWGRRHTKVDRELESARQQIEKLSERVDTRSEELRDSKAELRTRTSELNVALKHADEFKTLVEKTDTVIEVEKRRREQSERDLARTQGELLTARTNNQRNAAAVVELRAQITQLTGELGAKDVELREMASARGGEEVNQLLREQLAAAQATEQELRTQLTAVANQPVQRVNAFTQQDVDAARQAAKSEENATLTRAFAIERAVLQSSKEQLERDRQNLRDENRAMRDELRLTKEELAEQVRQEGVEKGTPIQRADAGLVTKLEQQLETKEDEVRDLEKELRTVSEIKGTLEGTARELEKSHSLLREQYVRLEEQNRALEKSASSALSSRSESGPAAPVTAELQAANVRLAELRERVAATERTNAKLEAENKQLSIRNTEVIAARSDLSGLQSQLERIRSQPVAEITSSQLGDLGERVEQIRLEIERATGKSVPVTERSVFSRSSSEFQIQLLFNYIRILLNTVQRVSRNEEESDSITNSAYEELILQRNDALDRLMRTFTLLYSIVDTLCTPRDDPTWQQLRTQLAQRFPDDVNEVGANKIVDVLQHQFRVIRSGFPGQALGFWESNFTDLPDLYTPPEEVREYDPRAPAAEYVGQVSDPVSVIKFAIDDERGWIWNEDEGGGSNALNRLVSVVISTPMAARAQVLDEEIEGAGDLAEDISENLFPSGGGGGGAESGDESEVVERLTSVSSQFSQLEQQFSQPRSEQRRRLRGRAGGDIVCTDIKPFDYSVTVSNVDNSGVQIAEKWNTKLKEYWHDPRNVTTDRGVARYEYSVKNTKWAQGTKLHTIAGMENETEVRVLNLWRLMQPTGDDGKAFLAIPADTSDFDTFHDCSKMFLRNVLAAIFASVDTYFLPRYGKEKLAAKIARRLRDLSVIADEATRKARERQVLEGIQDEIGKMQEAVRCMFVRTNSSGSKLLTKRYDNTPLTEGDASVVSVLWYYNRVALKPFLDTNARTMNDSQRQKLMDMFVEFFIGLFSRLMHKSFIGGLGHPLSEAWAATAIGNGDARIQTWKIDDLIRDIGLQEFGQLDRYFMSAFYDTPYLMLTVPLDFLIQGARPREAGRVKMYTCFSPTDFDGAKGKYKNALEQRSIGNMFKVLVHYAFGVSFEPASESVSALYERVAKSSVFSLTYGSEGNKSTRRFFLESPILQLAQAFYFNLTPNPLTMSANAADKIEYFDDVQAIPDYRARGRYTPKQMQSYYSEGDHKADDIYKYSRAAIIKK